ncbi:MAG: cytochrome c biogenesis protein CcsA [Saprospiraceae bacterium]
MSPIQYVGEHLWIGHVIHAAVIIGFLASINGVYAYFKNAKTQNTDWHRYGRWSYLIQGLMVVTTIGLLFYSMFNHYYEYEYVRHHISDDLKLKYLLAAFWEGQEGSFLLWMFWNVLLGLALIKTAGRWESPVMGLLSLMQAFLFSMIIGLYFGFGEHVLKLGSSPALLVRETFAAPIFQNPEYLKLIKGNGLNPLLQNYWMTIHPPTLFLGFASTIVPFLFAFSGWYYKDAKAWLKPAQEWALFSGFILGTGILMGGAWAYEALSFGGYWAWDPVENMSLVPWIMIIAGLHTNMIARATGRAVRTTYIYYLLAFILVLYASYMTRSGVLGETSAHAFTDMGLEWQLILLCVSFIGIGLYKYFQNKSMVSLPSDEDKINSREYWMFIGAMILLFSAVLITSSTSLPVFNKIIKLFQPDFKGHVIVDSISHHNRFQLWIAVLVCLLSGFAETLRFKEGHWDEFKSRFLKLITISVIAAAALYAATFKSLDSNSWQHLLLFFAGIFAICSNLTYLFTFLRGNLKLAGSAIAHLGFGVMVLGILFTGLNKKIISTNLFAQQDLIDGFNTEDYMKNLVLIKNAPMTIKEYEVTYNSDTLLDPFNREFEIRFDQKDAEGKTVKSFNSAPSLVYSRNENQSPSSNPSVHRSWKQDLYTYVNWLPPSMMNQESAEKSEAELKYQNYHITLNDTFFFSSGYGILKSLKNTVQNAEYEKKPGDGILACNLEFHQLNDTNTYTSQPAIISRGEFFYSLPAIQNDLGLKMKINPSSLEMYYPNSQDGKDAEMKVNDEVFIDGYKIKFTGFDKNPSHESFDFHPEDIAVAATLIITTPEGKQIKSEPIFCIRKNEVKVIPAFHFDDQIRLSCFKIDPQSESISIKFLKYNSAQTIDLDLAEKAPRNDMIVIQSILFPGINLFWLGAITMLGGVFISGIKRWIKF